MPHFTKRGYKTMFTKVTKVYIATLNSMILIVFKSDKKYQSYDRIHKNKHDFHHESRSRTAPLWNLVYNRPAAPPVNRAF